MKTKTTILTGVAAILLAAGAAALIVKFTAKASEPLTQIPAEYMGVHSQMDNAGEGYRLGFTCNEEGFFIYQAGFYDVAFAYSGEPKEIKASDNGITFDCVLIPKDGRDASESVAATIKMSKTELGLYEMQISSPAELPEFCKSLTSTGVYYKTDGERVEQTVPAKLEGKVTMEGLIKALSPYVFEPTMMAVRNYLSKVPGAESNGSETIRINEQNRCLEYSWEEGDSYMECKYWFTNDGDVLAVVLIHNGEYSLPQNLRFFKFDRNEGTMRELTTAMSDKWPIGEDDETHAIRYRLRCDIDGIEALVPNNDGGFDSVTLKFDGQLFR